MADNVEITKGSGTTIATDEVGGAQWQRIKVGIGADGSATDVSSANPMPITGAISATVSSVTIGALPALPAGSNLIGLVNATFSSLPAGTNNIGQVDPRGNVAHDSVDSGNPVKVGYRARTALPSAVAQDDRSDSISDKFGRQLTTVIPLDARVSETLNRTTNESGQLLAALAEGAYVVTAISVTNAHATVSTKVEILDGETVKWKGYAVAVGGGFVISDPNGLFTGSKNTKLNAKCATTGADVDISVSAYKIPA